MDEKLKQLADNLKKIGLASSMYEAVEKAKSIMNVKSQKPGTNDEAVQHENITPKVNLGVDIEKENVTLNELMEEVGVTPEQVEAQEKKKLDNVQEKIEDIKEGIKDTQENPEKIQEVKEEIEQVKEEVNEAEEAKDEEQEDIFKEEKKIDLNKVFGYK